MFSRVIIENGSQKIKMDDFTNTFDQQLLVLNKEDKIPKVKFGRMFKLYETNLQRSENTNICCNLPLSAVYANIDTSSFMAANSQATNSRTAIGLNIPEKMDRLFKSIENSKALTAHQAKDKDQGKRWKNWFFYLLLGGSLVGIIVTIAASILTMYPLIACGLALFISNAVGACYIHKFDSCNKNEIGIEKEKKI